MVDIRKLLGSVSEQENQLLNTQFLAPCVRNGLVRTRVSGMIYTFTPKSTKLEGWYLFRPISDVTVEGIEEANLPLVCEYLRLFKPFRVRLAYQLQDQTWLGFPVNESDAKQQCGAAKPVPIHLVVDGIQFDQVITRWDGASWWFEDNDRRADPMVAELLSNELRHLTPPERVGWKGITPEIRTVYSMALQQTKEFQVKRQHEIDENRLTHALRTGGGNLRKFHDRGRHWLVDWTSRNGERHTSTISKKDLTVVSSGICLSGRDRDFDLQSLVGVIENQLY